jgi:hypothetical protein
LHAYKSRNYRFLVKPFLRFNLLVVVLLACGGLSLRAGPAQGTNAAPATGFATLAWAPSTANNVAGYFVFSGLASGVYTAQLDVGNTNSVLINGLETNVTYYFEVIAYDSTGTQSPPSNEISYSTSAALVAAPATLGIRFGLQGSSPVLGLSFPGSTGHVYHIEASTNLQDWATVWSTNCVSNGTLVFYDTAIQPARFYRLQQQ